MEGRIPERDWKIWRTLSEVALNRFCQKILDEAAEFADGDGTPHERYGRLFQHIKKRDRVIADVFDEPSRSRAYMQIAFAARKRIITREELGQFSEEASQVIARLLDGV
jgi:hypothetical protein